MADDDIKEGKISWKFMLPLVLGTMMNPLNSTMLATALITLCGSFHTSVGQGAILIVSLYVTSTVAQPLMGRLADIFSAKKINALGFLLVFAAALVGIFAPAFNWLILSRILMGLGTSAAYPSAISLINKKYAEAKLPVPGNVLGIIAISGQVSAVMGPTLGGLLTEFLGWRGIFFINVPWVIVGLILSRSIPDYPSSKINKGKNILQRIDAVGIILFSSFLLSLLFLLLQIAFSRSYFGLTILFLAATIWWEWRHEAPFIDVELIYKRPALALVYVRTLCTYYILYLLLYALPQWLQSIRHIQPAHVGLMLMPMTLTAITSGYLISKLNKPVLQNVIGTFVMLAACGCIFLINVDTPIYLFIGCTIVAGLADGINMIANQSLLNQESPLAQKGVSFGLFRTAGYIGAIASGTQLKKLFSKSVTDHSFHLIGFYALASGAVLLLLIIPLVMRKKQAA
jgi:MFS family permease